ncbi:acyl-CoA dehydrogenase family protein [Streptantibioticus ferralitis]|uniref:short-chain 2-methylacyl-CoA dehydrogenase n=1 Tax=Streptantibioticus ferralitis TaxID=236510 RepID=A0ABT5Z1Q9_9ACTN|nr:acyl-CoA dehydrogenase family protein [Streptantibioticus ferralitis]MDF2257756.1 acyl-CoA dehydrogenase family protein [Streptantibioticus ferralitis]
MRPDPLVPDPAAPALTRLTEADERWRDHVRAFAEKEIRPLSAEMDRTGALDPGLRQRLFDSGLMSIAIPAAYGGLGGGLFHVVQAIEEVARVDAGVAVGVDVHNALVVATLLRAASGDQHRRYLPLLAATKVGAFAISEEQAGSDAFALTTTARSVPGGYVLDGRKKWTSNADQADVFLVFANGPDGSGVSAFLVDRDTPGLSVVHRTEQLGVRAASTGDLVLRGVRVRAGQCLGGVGGGRALAADALDVGRLGIAAQLVGLAQGALEHAVEYSRTREQFGQRISGYQGVQFTLARMHVDVEAARVLLYNATRVFEAGADRLERTKQAAMAKYFASEVAERTASLAVEVLGGNGYTREHPVERFYRDAKVGKIYEGTSNMLLRSIAAILIGAAS